MKRLLTLLSSGSAAAALLVTAPAGATAIHATSVSLSFLNGSAPMAGVAVNVYLDPGYAKAPSAGSTRSLPLLGSGVTNARGMFAAPLNTVAVTGSLGDPGTGTADSFNAVAVAMDSARDVAVRYMILKLGHSVSATVHAHAMPVAARPASSGGAVTTKPAMTASYVSTKYEWVPVLAENSSHGMKAHFEYTHNSSKGIGIQTSASVVQSDTGVSPWTVSGSAEEASFRSSSRPYNVRGNYHSQIFVKYSFHKVKYKWCDRYGVNCSTWYTWQIGSWNGDITDNDTDPACNHCGYSVGVKRYKVPRYTKKRNDTFPLTVNSPWYTRSTGQTFHYAFKFDFAGFISVTATSSYGSITSVTWTRLSSGCAKPKKTLLWGNGHIVPKAPIVQANCFRRPK